MMKMDIRWKSRGWLALSLLCCLMACTPDGMQEENKDQSDQTPQFELLSSEQTGLDFANVLEQSSEFNVFNYMYFYNGGGVAAGDFNNDGKTDLFFTSNMGPNKMFLNEGDMTFRDVSEIAAVQGIGGWTSGVTVVDINLDGMLDLYVSQIGEYQTLRGENQLLVCQKIENGVPVYANEAYIYGLNQKVFGTQAAFFDYDKDGDLDMYQLNHSLHQNGTFGQRNVFQKEKHPESGDKLFRNDQGRFVEVTLEAGINSTVIGYGLGMATGDVNQDGWPDIYIGNDFHENDYLYLNQQDGTFKEVLTEQIRHTSRFSMGVDISDINNDAQADVISLDMLPYDPNILKASLGEDAYNIFTFKLGYGYNHQFSRNNLQLNNGDDTFSEIGMFADVHATDWSWAPLFLDMDHDGYKDLFISNGIPRRMNDIDYVNFRANNDLRWKQNTNNLEDQDLSLIDKMPQIKLPNKFFKNQGDLRFKELGMAIKGNRESYSNGAVYADFDGDGDLDIVVNNIDDAPFLYKNLTIESKRKGDFIHLKLAGPKENPLGIGAKLVVFKGDKRLIQEHYLTRGYQSSVAPGIHMGLGNGSEIDSMVLVWPDDSYQTISKEWVNAAHQLEFQEGLPEFDMTLLRKKVPTTFAFRDITQEAKLTAVHEENPFVEFNRETLIPHMVSREGPAIAVADANGDGLDDLFLGNSKRRKAQLFFQQVDGTFTEKTPVSLANDSLIEDVDAVWVDIEKDGDLDLVVASGGNEFWGSHKALNQRLYINDGKGDLQAEEDAFGEVFMTAACVLAADVNGDGFEDLFFGGRVVPWKYGEVPRSYLFINQKDGTFKDQTAEWAPELSQVGMVKQGQWTDLDKDGDQDLLLAMEWDALQLFVNDGQSLSQQAINKQKGWWNMVEVSDFDGDGDLDILAGNTGKNSKLKPSSQAPVKLYIEDYDNNSKVEQILTYVVNGREIPFANYSEITQQLPGLKKQFLYAKDFAAANLPSLLGKEKINSAIKLEANEFASVWLENTGEGMEFISHDLPDLLQFSTLNAAWTGDLDQDGKEEVVLAGNFYECNIEMGRYDANMGNVLQIGKGGNMELTPLGDIRLHGQVRKIIPLKVKGKTVLAFARNNDAVQLLSVE